MRIPFSSKKPSEQAKGFVQVTLTPNGIREGESFEGEGSKFEVLAALLTKRPQSIGSLAKAASISFPKCLDVCKELKNEGLITQVSRAE